MKPNTRWGYVTDGLALIGFGLLALAFAAGAYWVSNEITGAGRLPINTQMRRPVSSALVMGLPTEVLQIAALIVAGLAVLAALFFAAHGFWRWIELVRDYRTIAQQEAEDAARRARRAARHPDERSHHHAA
jgi:hypothetical protein